MSSWVADCNQGLGVGVGAGGQMPLGTSGPTGQEPPGVLGYPSGSAGVTAGFENTGSVTGGTVVTGAPSANQEGARPSSDDDNTYGLSWGTRKGNR
jgi:hypothetical protein